MGMRRRIVVLGAIVAGLCGSGLAHAESLVIPGSGNPEHVLKVLADAFNRVQSEHRVSVPPSNGTAGAIRDVLADSASLGRVGRPLKPDELARGLVFVPIGRDPVSFVAGAGVTVRNLSTAQVLQAFSGQIDNWRELGGKPAPIRAIGREITDASRQAISRAIPAFEKLAFGDNAKLVHLDPQMIELLDRFPSSLGFLNRSALAACQTPVVMLSLDGVPSTPQNVGVGRYPLWLELGLVHKPGGLGPAARAFIAFVRSSEGVRLLREQGVLASARPS